MSSEVEKAIAELEENIGSDHLEDYQEKVIAAINAEPDREQYLPVLFGFFERYENADWGMPGSFVNFIEEFPESVYRGELIASLERKPTDHTLWMLNRIANQYKAKADIEMYCGIFEKAAACPNASGAAVKETLNNAQQSFRRMREPLNLLY